MEESERVILEEGIELRPGVLRIFQKSYDFDLIEGVVLIKHRQSPLGPTLLGLMGLAFFFVIWWLGILFIGASFVWWLSASGIYGLEISYNGSRVNALYHKDGEMMKRLCSEVQKRMANAHRPNSGQKK